MLNTVNRQAIVVQGTKITKFLHMKQLIIIHYMNKVHQRMLNECMNYIVDINHHSIAIKILSTTKQIVYCLKHIDHELFGGIPFLVEADHDPIDWFV